MRETADVYIFPSFRYPSLIFAKLNYKRHLERHPEIEGAEGLAAIEDVLTNPDCVTEYAQKNKLGKTILKTEVFYKKLGKRKTFQGRQVLDFWKIIIVRDEPKNQWEIATAFIKSGPEYAMINNRIETIIYPK